MWADEDKTRTDPHTTSSVSCIVREHIQTVTEILVGPCLIDRCHRVWAKWKAAVITYHIQAVKQSITNHVWWEWVSSSACAHVGTFMFQHWWDRAVSGMGTDANSFIHLIFLVLEREIQTHAQWNTYELLHAHHRSHKAVYFCPDFICPSLCVSVLVMLSSEIYLSFCALLHIRCMNGKNIITWITCDGAWQKAFYVCDWIKAQKCRRRIVTVCAPEAHSLSPKVVAKVWAFLSKHIHFENCVLLSKDFFCKESIALPKRPLLAVPELDELFAFGQKWRRA